MYDIYTVVYGIPYTKEIELAANRAEGFSDDEIENFDYLYLEDYGFVFKYSGHVPEIAPGYFGEILDGGAAWEVDAKKMGSLKPTPEQVAEVQAKFDALPDWLKAASPPLDIYTIWSTS
jgi:hypothetical protein